MAVHMRTKRVYAHCHKEKFIGWLSVIITEYNIMTLYQRNMLMCTEWLVLIPPLSKLLTENHIAAVSLCSLTLLEQTANNVRKKTSCVSIHAWCVLK